MNERAHVCTRRVEQCPKASPILGEPEFGANRLARKFSSCSQAVRPFQSQLRVSSWSGKRHALSSNSFNILRFFVVICSGGKRQILLSSFASDGFSVAAYSNTLDLGTRCASDHVDEAYSIPYEDSDLIFRT